MKLLYRPLLILIVLALLPYFSVAKGDDIEKKKTVEKSFSVDQSTRLKIHNSFGRVHINSWDREEFEVTVEVIVRKRNDQRAQSTLDQIEIEVSDGKEEIFFKTNLNGGIKTKGASEEFEVNYVVNMPEINPLEVKLNFGDIYVADRSGTNNMEIAYGDLKFQNLVGESMLKISFCEGAIESVESGEVIVKYSELDINRLGMVKLENSFSEVSIQKAETILLKSKYGEFNLGEVRGLKGSVGFSEFNVGKILVEADLQSSHAGDFKIEQVARGFKSLKLDGKFDDYWIGFEEGANASFSVKTSFSDLEFDRQDVDISYQVKENNKSEYRGILGNGRGGVIEITSAYGDVKFK